MIEYFAEHQHTGWFTLGFILLGVEMLVLGFSTGFVLFIGLAALLTGSLIWFDLIPHTWLAGVASFGVSSAVISALLYKPLKSLQNNSDEGAKDTSSDIIGLEFRIEQDVTPLNTGVKKYSGIDWKIEIDKSAEVDELSVGTLVKVVSVDVAVLRVVPV